MDLLAAILADPPSLLAWLVLAFAAGMYPVGIMLGSSCSPCCASCSQCAEGALPDTITVTLDDIPDTSHLVWLNFSGAFDGNYAAHEPFPPARGRATAPGGDPATDKGPITAAEILNGGSGFARLGRVEPTLAFSTEPGGGTGGTFTPTLFNVTDSAINVLGLPMWGVESLSVSGGSGWSDGDQVAISAAEGSVQVAWGTATVYTLRIEPEITASVSGGSGAELEVAVVQVEANSWRIDSINIVNGGTGYADQSPVAFTGPSLVQEVPPEIYALTDAETGEIVSIQLIDGGSYYRSTDELGSATIDNGGAFYAEDASIAPHVATINVGIEQHHASNGTGAQLSATVDDDVESPTFGQIVGVTIDDGGSDYLAYDTKNEFCCGSFWNGRSVVLKRNNQKTNWGGTVVGYLADPCRFAHAMYGGWTVSGYPSPIYLEYRGPDLPPVIVSIFESDIGYAGPPYFSNTAFDGGYLCNGYWIASRNVTDCSDWSDITWTRTDGATATVTVGGEYDETYMAYKDRDLCCQGSDDVPEEIEISLTHNADPEDFDGILGSEGVANGLKNILLTLQGLFPDGNYVLTGGEYYSEYRGLRPAWIYDLDPTLENAGGNVLMIQLMPCIEHVHEYTPNTISCYACNKQCRTVVWFAPLEIQEGGLVSFDFGPNTFDIPYNKLAGTVANPSCDECNVATPTCAPSGTVELAFPVGDNQDTLITLEFL